MSYSTYPSFPKGSQWRKWDLQVHTPFSYLNNQFGEDWDIYVQQLFKMAIAKDIAVIGITDYFTIEGYKKILSEYLESPTKLASLFTPDEIEQIKKIKIFPNIEFRLNKLVGTNRINLHVIFSDKLSAAQIEDSFLHDLHFVHDAKPFSPETEKPLKLHHLIALGAELKAGHEPFRDRSDIFIGMMNAVVDDKEIMKILTSSSLFQDKYLICTPADEDLSNISWDAQDHNVRKVIIQKSNIILTSNNNTREWGLGKKHPSVNDFISEFKTVKPCIWSSDAHGFDKLFEPDNQKYTWVKADPTFEGLRQIMYESEDRIAIQATIPEEKRPYFVIDKVRFIDNVGQNDFPPEYIEVNPNLNSIIGGKSTGKSLLLYYIAKTTDIDELQKRIFDMQIPADVYPFDKSPNFDFEVVWADGAKSRLKRPENGEDPTQRKVIYIPQHYLNKLSERNIKSKETLNDFIQSVILQDPGALKFYDEKQLSISSLEKKLPIEIDELFSLKENDEKISAQLKNIGDKSGIAKSIDILKQQVKEVKDKSGLNPEELKDYDVLSEKQKVLQQKISNLTHDKNIVDNIFRSLSVDIEKILGTKTGMTAFLMDQNIIPLIDQRLNALTMIPASLAESREEILVLIDQKISSSSAELKSVETSLQPIIGKIKLQSEIEQRLTIIKQEEDKLSRIELLQNDLKVIQENHEKKRLDIINLYQSLLQQYLDLQKEFKQYAGKLADIVLNIVIGFQTDEFNKDIISQFINKNDLKKILGENWPEGYEFKFDLLNHTESMSLIFNGILSGEVKTIKDRQEKDAIIKILSNKFFIDYKISYQGDSLDKMSPGTKGLVLLKILVSLSNDQWPILLDQPEDDLDNRSVYSELVKFIQSKKKERQIIIATHNPNLVVGADSEESIVANQKGKNAYGDNEMFKFEYVSGSLENSFENPAETAILQRYGIREHIYQILEGGKEAFQKREQKYNLQ